MIAVWKGMIIALWITMGESSIKSENEIHLGGVQSRNRNIELDDNDIICENIFYVVVEADHELFNSTHNGPNEWVCNMKENDGNMFVYAIKNIPAKTFEYLMDWIDTISGSTQMILRQARDFLDHDTCTINIPSQTTSGNMFEIEILHNSPTQQKQRLFPTINTVLVIRVIGSELNEELSTNGSIIDSSELSRRVFGGFDDIVNLKDQYAACSANHLVIEKASGYNDIIEGVLEVELDISTSSEILKPWDRQTNEYLENKISEAAKAKLGVSEELENIFDLVMICLPEGTNVKTAYARLGGKRSVYSGDNCIWPSYQMHVIGHNLRLHHSNQNGVQYEDHLGLMGATYTGNHEFPRMCFNGVKSWLFGWYQDKSISLDPNPRDPNIRIWSLKLVGVTDYLKAPRGEYVVTIELKGIPNREGEQDSQLETAYYLQYNRQAGVNMDTQDFANKVIITKGQLKRVNLKLREKRESSHVFDLSIGQMVPIPDYKGSGINLWIKLCDENKWGKPPFAHVYIFYSTEQDPCQNVSTPITFLPDDSDPNSDCTLMKHFKTLLRRVLR